MKIIGNALPNLPWEERPAGSTEIIWRYSQNPVIGWNPTPSTARVYNSAVLPYNGEFVGVFRADHKNGRANIHFGRSKDGMTLSDRRPCDPLAGRGRKTQPGQLCL